MLVNIAHQGSADEESNARDDHQVRVARPRGRHSHLTPHVRASSILPRRLPATATDETGNKKTECSPPSLENKKTKMVAWANCDRSSRCKICPPGVQFGPDDRHLHRCRALGVQGESVYPTRVTRPAQMPIACLLASSARCVEKIVLRS